MAWLERTKRWGEGCIYSGRSASSSEYVGNWEFPNRFYIFVGLNYKFRQIQERRENVGTDGDGDGDGDGVLYRSR